MEFFVTHFKAPVAAFFEQFIMERLNKEKRTFYKGSERYLFINTHKKDQCLFKILLNKTILNASARPRRQS